MVQRWPACIQVSSRNPPVTRLASAGRSGPAREPAKEGCATLKPILSVQDRRFRKAQGVDGISFAVHPRTVDEVPSTPGVRPGRPAAPSRSPPPVFLAGVVFHLPWLKVRSSIAFTVSTRWTPAARAVRWTAALASGRRGCAAGRAFDRRAEGCAAGVAAWTERARRRGPRQSGGMTHDHVSGGA